MNPRIIQSKQQIYYKESYPEPSYDSYGGGESYGGGYGGGEGGY